MAIPDQPVTCVADLLHHPDVWRAGRRLEPRTATLATGHPALDGLLADGGWPRAGLMELLLDHLGIGELRLLSPALAALSAEPRWLAWINPPHIPYAPALSNLGIDVRKVLLVHPRQHQDALWTLERALRSGTCSTVLAWLDESRLRAPQIRRLKLAAREGGTLAVLFRPLAAAQQPSMAELRLGLRAGGDNTLAVEVCKRRGGWPTALRLSLPAVVQLDHTALAQQLTLWRAYRPHRAVARNSNACPARTWRESATIAPPELGLH
jgi:hypothetical protein